MTTLTIDHSSASHAWFSSLVHNTTQLCIEHTCQTTDNAITTLHCLPESCVIPCLLAGILCNAPVIPHTSPRAPVVNPFRKIGPSAGLEAGNWLATGHSKLPGASHPPWLSVLFGAPRPPSLCLLLGRARARGPRKGGGGRRPACLARPALSAKKLTLPQGRLSRDGGAARAG